MGPKKKGKVNKLARMSEEEKLRYLQHRAAIEEEAKRRKEHIIASYMKNKLKHEEAFMRLNTAKINQQWRQTLRQIKNKELHDATETMRQVFEIALKTKNIIIENLLTDMNDSEKQHDLAVQTHMVAIDQILGIQSGRMSNINENYSDVKERILYQSGNERARLENSFNRDKRIMETMIFWERKHYDTDIKHISDLSSNYRKEIMYKLMSDMSEEKISAEEVMETIKKEIAMVVNSYQEKFKPFKSHYKELCLTDERNRETTEANQLTIREFKESLEKLKKERKFKYKKHQDELAYLKEQIKLKKQEYNNLKQYVANNYEESNKSMIKLSNSSNLCIKKLTNTEKTVNLIAHIHEKSKIFLNEEEKIQSYLPQKPATFSKDIPLDQMSNFLNKFGELQVEVTNLEAYYTNYLEENIYLKQLLKQYLNTISRPSSVPSLGLKRRNTQCRRAISAHK